jgi:hypothetical protein
MCIRSVSDGRANVPLENIPFDDGGLLVPEPETPLWEDDGPAPVDLPLGEPVGLTGEVLDILENYQAYIVLILAIGVAIVAYSLREFV